MLNRTDLRTLPNTPGGYVIKDAEGVPLFISWAKDIKEAVLGHSKAIGSPREKAIALAYLAQYVEIFEGAEESRIEGVIQQDPPQFNSADFDPNKMERLTLVIPPALEASMRLFARIRYVRARRKGQMRAATPAEYVRWLLKRDIESGVAAIRRRRSEID